ncbi:MAG TPA: glycosyltransferase family 2 protein [Phenylobacterium sp.]
MAFVPEGDTQSVELSILVVSYNTRAETLEALESLFRHPPPVNFEVIVLDNASSDGSFEAIRAAFPKITAIAHPTNVGFAVGNNVAARSARGRRILLLNPDTVSLETSHAALWAFAERTPERRIWGGRTLFADGTLNPSSCWRRMTLWSVFCVTVGLTYLFLGSRIFNFEAYGSWKRDTEADVDIVTGCFLLIDADLWNQLGGFDETFFMYAEEADLCHRAIQLGARPGISPTAVIIHHGGKSERVMVDKRIRISAGRVTFMRKHWSWLGQELGRRMMMAGAFMRVIASRVVRGRRDDPGAAKDQWGAFWRRRGEWSRGYAPVARR